MQVFITAIGTDSGKTVVSAIFTQALGAMYWKPIQAGFPRDTETVQQLVGNPKSRFLNEAYLLTQPMSPHAAAQIDEVLLKVENIQKPESTHLVVEGAGGILVPINDTQFVIDIAAHLNLPVVLVCNLYLGSINHSLLSLMELQRRNVPLLGIVFNGPPNAASEHIIEQYAQVPVLLRIPQSENVSPEWISAQAKTLSAQLEALNLLQK